MNPAAARRSVMYLSGTRADFGLMRSTLQSIAAHPDLRLGVAVTGTHLSAAHGATVGEIESAGLTIAGRIAQDVHTRTAASMSQGIADVLHGMTALLERQRPDVLVLLGDRGEMLAGAIAALHLGVPTLHIHGGERSGTVDEPVRHAISKLASLHAVATAQSRERLLRLGEDDWRIHLTGAPGLDGLAQLGGDAGETATAFMSSVGLDVREGFILCVFHPVVQQAELAAAQTLALARAVSEPGLPVLWLEPNADAGAREVIQALDRAGLPPGSRRMAHLPRGDFCRAMRHARVMVGNSSSGIIEAATFGTPVINVGDRQRLRERNANVTDVAADVAAIREALARALSAGRQTPQNVYGDGHAGQRITRLLATVALEPRLLDKANAY